ncbi:hypothetical protein P692DRAFT_201807864 [Suillus brevipes Sb2]|nr:hypothetical protein P692DRAFT_201807864 [Suillus brevipes Sb2]
MEPFGAAVEQASKGRVIWALWMGGVMREDTQHQARAHFRTDSTIHDDKLVYCLSQFSIKLVSKYGVSQGDRWILLLIFCFIRVLGGSLLVAAEEVTPVNLSLYIGGYTLESSGLSPLLVCTLGLLHSIQFCLLQILGAVALVLTIIGISNSSSDSSSLSANTMRRVGVILFAVLYIGMLIGICVFLWTQTRFIMRYHKQLLKAIPITLPFLAIWTLYSVLSTFSSSSFDALRLTSLPVDVFTNGDTIWRGYLKRLESKHRGDVKPNLPKHPQISSSDAREGEVQDDLKLRRGPRQR